MHPTSQSLARSGRPHDTYLAKINISRRLFLFALFLQSTKQISGILSSLRLDRGGLFRSGFLSRCRRHQ